jgi:hypothetical protein
VSAGKEESGVEQDGTRTAQVGGGCHGHFRGGFLFFLARYVVCRQMRMSGAVRVYIIQKD